MKISYKKTNAIFLIFLSLIFLASALGIDEKLTNFIHEYFTFIFIIFLLSLSICIYDVIMKIKQITKENYNSIHQEKEFLNIIKNLSYEEKNILSLFLESKSHEKALNPDDQAVACLESVKLIFNTGEIEGNKKRFKIHPSVSKYLVQNPNALY